MAPRVLFVLFMCLTAHPFIACETSIESKCPKKTTQGQWTEDGDRCILRCEAGYEPSSCHVIRYIRGKWNNNIPICQKVEFFSEKALAAIGAGTAGIPFVFVGVAASVASQILHKITQFPSTRNSTLLVLARSACTAIVDVAIKGAEGASSEMIKHIASYLNLDCEEE